MWDRYAFPRRTRLLLDLYGTNHDGRIGDPSSRAVQAKQPGQFEFVPQGEVIVISRTAAPGEPITVELKKASVRFLRTELSDDVPDQDLELVFSKLPALPESRFIIANVQRKPKSDPQEAAVASS